MIIQLDQSLIGAANSSDEGLSSIVSMLELVAISYREGNHLVYADLSVSSQLVALTTQKSSLATALLLKIINKHPQTAALAKNVKVKLLIGAFENAEIEETANCRVIKYPAPSITSNTIQRTIILVENLTDIQFYKWIARSILQDTDYNEVPLSIEGYPGGGNTTAEAYQNIKDNTSRLCLCIVDSDIRAPSLSPGETAKKVSQSDKRSPNPRTSHHMIDACSIENLIPFSFFEHAWRDDPNYAEKLKTYRAHHRNEHWKYLQLKKSISCFETRDTNAFARYWGKELADSTAGCATQDRSCPKKSDCAQLKLAPLSGAPLAAVLAIEEKEMRNISYELLPDIQRAWESITYELLGWCCAAPSSSL